MAKRLSSLFSLNNNNGSDHSNSNSRPASSIIDHPAKDTAPATLARKSTPDLRPTPPTPLISPEAQNYRASTVTPPIDTSRLSPQQGNPTFPPITSPGQISDSIQTGVLRKPIPIRRSDSPGIDRPISRGSGAGSRAPSRDGSGTHSRTASPANLSRPHTPNSENRLSKRMSWFPGRGSDHLTGNGVGHATSPAWTIGPQVQDKANYDLSPLINFQKVPELWNDSSDTIIYLHSRDTARGPSFKVDSSIYAASRKLAAAAYGRLPNITTSRAPQEYQYRNLPDRTNAPIQNDPMSPQVSQRGSSNRSSSTGGRSSHDYFDEGPRRHDIHLCIPSPLQCNIADPNSRLTENDVELFITIRNVFAFLSGLPLVATARQPSLFDIFLQVSDVLHRYEFTNLDASTLGEEANTAFTRYVDDFKMADVRHSREKTLEAVVLGERMKYWPLYNEGFVHAVGKFDEIKSLQSPKYGLISKVTRTRMERATIDLEVRLRNLRLRLDDFEFPSLFAGFANSTSSSESKIIRFKAWKSSYLAMRRWVISMYKQQYGAWPPKARSKKNDFEESGLNRILLQDLYNDFSSLYDILVDRSALTTRHSELSAPDTSSNNSEDTTIRALRRILSESDRSIAPVQPPVPFDAPLLPSLASIRRDFSGLDARKQKKENMRSLSKDDANQILLQATNRDLMKSTPFILSFMTFERQWAQGKSLEEMIDLRVGQWLFIYAVLQTLPLVVIDAPDLKFNQGVEHFLCEVPLDGPPWIQESQQHKQAWYGVAGGSGLVSLPAHLVEHGVDGIYHRSHCWTMAEKWAQVLGEGDDSNGDSAYPNYGDDPPSISPVHHYEAYAPPTQFPEQTHSRKPSLPLPAVISNPGSRSQSPNNFSARRASALNLSSLGLGLEQLPLPQGVTVTPTGAAAASASGSNVSSRPVSQHDPTKSFDAILAASGGNSGGKGKKK